MKAKTTINGVGAPRKNLVGQKFGMLTLLEYVGKNKWGHALWMCSCQCGSKKVMEGKEVWSGRTKSCGCNQNPIIHGHCRRTGASPLYQAHQDMIKRCFDARGKAWKYYGGRGITVCERWMKFENFAHDMGPALKSGLTLDRIDNNGNYEPGNCRWATRLVQGNNKRSNRIITIDGISKTMSEWARHMGMSYGALELRINALGWDEADAVITPVRVVNRKPRAF